MTRKNDFGGFTAHRRCCSLRTFNEGGCSVTFPNRNGRWVSISGTSYQKNHNHSEKLCDLLFSWARPNHGLASAALELKGGGIDVTGVIQQLQNGANIIADLLTDIDTVFVPVLVHRAMPPIQHRALKTRQIRFRGRNYLIALVKCPAVIGHIKW